MPAAQSVMKSLCQGGIISRLALPYHLYLPTETCQRFGGRGITSDVSFELALPVSDVARRSGRSRADGASMPETAMDKEHGMPTREHQVRSAGQIFTMQPKTVAEAMNQPAHTHLGRGIRALDLPHDGASLLRREYIRHQPIVDDL